MIILHACSSLLHVPFPFSVTLLNFSSWKRQLFRIYILVSGIASWVRGRHTPKRKKLLFKVEPILVTFWDVGIETLRETEWIGSRAKRYWHRESSQVTLIAKHREGGPRDLCCWGPWSHAAPCPIPELWQIYLFLGSWEATCISALWIGNLNFYFFQLKQSLPKPAVNPSDVHYVKIGLCNSSFTSEGPKKEKLQHICWVAGVITREPRDGGC